jgi:hypothetical protein
VSARVVKLDANEVARGIVQVVVRHGGCYRRDYLRTTVGAPARIFGDDFSLGD